MQILATFGVSLQQPEAPATPAPAQMPEYVGAWTATLPNSASVQLALQADGSFIWTAINKGTTSAFQGSYSIANGTLTLTRSNDNQNLTGQFTMTDNGGFTFKLSGAQDAGLSFARS